MKDLMSGKEQNWKNKFVKSTHNFVITNKLEKKNKGQKQIEKNHG